jgi:putative transposase
VEAVVSAREQAEATVAMLLERRSVHGPLPNAVVGQAAGALGVSTSTLRRWLAKRTPKPAQRDRWVPDDEDLLRYFECKGNVAGVFRLRKAVGLESPTLRQLQRAFDKALSPAERAFAKDREAGYRRYSVYLRVEASHRNQLWQADHVELPVWMSVPRRTIWLKPWLTVFIDCFSRAIVGYALSLQPTRAEVLAALRAAIVVDPDRGPFGGVPGVIRWDNGTEFLSDDVSHAVASLGIYAAPTAAYAPYQKGKVERFFATLESEFLSLQPFYTGGPRSANDKLYGPGDGPMGLEEFAVRFEQYVRDYNHSRTHSAIGTTPQQAWEGNSQPLQLVDEDKLRWMLLAADSRKVRKDGILFGNVLFFATELQGLVGEEVTVRHMPHDLRRIWVYRDGECLCEAVPHQDLSESARRAHLGNRAAHRKRASDLRRQLSRNERATRRQKKGRIEPMTEPGDVVDTVAPLESRPRRVADRPVDPSVLRTLGIGKLNEPLAGETVEVP